MKIALKDGHSTDTKAGDTAGTALFSLGVSGPDVLAAKVDGAVVDLSRPLAGGVLIEPLRFDSAEGREVYRHSSTHVMAQAVKELFNATSPSHGGSSPSRRPSISSHLVGSSTRLS